MFAVVVFVGMVVIRVLALFVAAVALVVLAFFFVIVVLVVVLVVVGCSLFCCVSLYYKCYV